MPTEGKTALPVLLAGAALVSLGVLRLAGAALRRMPRIVAAGVVVAGAGVMATGFFLRLEQRLALRPAALATTEPARTPAPVGTITGDVHDASGRPVPRATVTLHRFEHADEVQSVPTRTGDDGRFLFQDLPVAETTAYAVSTDYAGTTFRSDLVFLDPAAPGREVRLRVAPATSDASVLSVAVDSTVLVGDARGVQVVQVVSLRNASGDAYAGGLRLPLLPRASLVDPRQGLDRTGLSLDSGDLVSSAPVLPGRTEIVYTYAVPMPRGGLSVRRTFHYPTRRFALLVGGHLAARAPALTDEGRARPGGAAAQAVYRTFAARAIGPGRSVTARLTVARLSVPLRTGGVAAAIAIAVAAIVYPIVRRRPHAPEDAGVPGPEPVAEP